MDETNGSIFEDAWIKARVGNAIDVLVDRTLNRPQYTNDPAQAYGVDANGNLYMLGQRNGQVVATVNNGAPSGSNGLMAWLILGAIALVVLESK